MDFLKNVVTCHLEKHICRPVSWVIKVDLREMNFLLVVIDTKPGFVFWMPMLLDINYYLVGYFVPGVSFKSLPFTE